MSDAVQVVIEEQRPSAHSFVGVVSLPELLLEPPHPAAANAMAATTAGARKRPFMPRRLGHFAGA